MWDKMKTTLMFNGVIRLVFSRYFNPIQKRRKFELKNPNERIV